MASIKNKHRARLSNQEDNRKRKEAKVSSTINAFIITMPHQPVNVMRKPNVGPYTMRVHTYGLPLPGRRRTSHRPKNAWGSITVMKPNNQKRSERLPADL